MTDVPIEEAKLVGGSPQDRRRLLERLHEYLDINARFDWEPLQDLWSGMPGAVFFNLNGHTYNGPRHAAPQVLQRLPIEADVDIEVFVQSFQQTPAVLRRAADQLGFLYQYVCHYA